MAEYLYIAEALRYVVPTTLRSEIAIAYANELGIDKERRKAFFRACDLSEDGR